MYKVLKVKMLKKVGIFEFRMDYDKSLSNNLDKCNTLIKIVVRN